MCLGIPARITAITDARRRLATVSISGVSREVSIACVLEHGEEPGEDLIGEWVLVHVGFAMARIAADEAARTLALFDEMGLLEAPP